MTDFEKKQILKFVGHPDYRPVNIKKLAKSLGVEDDQLPAFQKAADRLRKEGHLIFGSGNAISLPAMPSRVVGIYRGNPSGFGFVVPEQTNVHGDLFIPPGRNGGAVTGDTVAAKVTKSRGRGGRYSGTVIDILERANNRFVGTLVRKQSQWFILPDGKGFTEPILVEDVTAKNAREKDKVVVEVIRFPVGDYPAQGVIVEVLGRSGTYETEISAIIHSYHLPIEFDRECLQQASQTAGQYDPDNLVSREDITDKVIITIDPPDAKDFDDAISLETDGDGNRVLGVHIADVSTFIKEDSPLDIEARKRGNSVYLPRRTIPMLPEVLSNGICSLQPDQKRFTKSVYITYDDDGEVVGRRFANSLICSSKRLTYQQADKILKGKHSNKNIPKKVVTLLKGMEKLASAIEKRRYRNGMLHLDMVETELIFDKAGRVVDAAPADDSYPHTIIEMFMVEANEAVASVLDRKNISLMRRVHPEPNALNLENLAYVLKSMGIAIPKNASRFVLQDVLEAVRGKDIGFAVNMLVLRSFEKAVYSPANMGHYALASRHYCHFTSPIRRYADLIVHRRLASLMANRRPSSQDELDLVEVGGHISFTEQRAADAEEELKTVLILIMLKNHLGETFDGVTTGLTRFGVFVQSVKYGIEGLIQVNELGPDDWVFDKKTQSITGGYTGVSIRMGQKIAVRIASVDIAARQLGLIPSEPLVKKTARKTRKTKHKPKSRRTTKRRRR